MKRIIIFVMGLIVSINLVSCTRHSGNVRIENDNVIGQIVKGKTTKKQVLTLLGKPFMSQIYGEEGAEMWMYNSVNTRYSAKDFIPFANLGSGFGNSNMKHIIVFFSPNGVVHHVDRGNVSGF